MPTKPDAPEISVVVAHLNQPEPLRLLLASLFAQDFDMRRAEVIVVDNGSRALPRDVVAAFPGVVLAEEARPGPGHARNRGVALSRSPLIAFTDSDCRVAPDWLAVILQRFAEPLIALIRPPARELDIVHPHLGVVAVDLGHPSLLVGTRPH